MVDGAAADDGRVHFGCWVVLEDDEGEEHPYWIAEIKGEDVVLDPNHPLAGVTLHFEVEIIEVRDATEEELTHGHSHGEGGHSH